MADKIKYTKEQLQVMSKSALGKQLDILSGMYCEDAFGTFMPTLDVDNVSGIMPLAFQHKICLINESDGGWIAFLFGRDEIEFAHENPLMAIACCLILALQGKDE